MYTSMLLEMAAEAAGDQVAIGSITDGLTYGTLLELSRQAASLIDPDGSDRVVFVDVNSELIPILLFGAGMAGRAFVPVNYRWTDDQLSHVLDRFAPCLAVLGADVRGRIAVGSTAILDASVLMPTLSEADQDFSPAGDPDDVAVLLFTSGTTGEPKAAVLRHRHLTSYVVNSVEFMGAAPDEANLVSVPPYHIAGISAVLSSIHAGRRIVYMPTFSPEGWVKTAREQAISHAMVVPTMLSRILDVLEGAAETLPTLTHLSYGGGPMPVSVIERALSLLPQVDFVNAYGLTETSSTIAVLGPEDHRTAYQSDSAATRRRLGSVGRPLPAIELEVRDEAGNALPPGQPGLLWVRGDQVAGEYVGPASADNEGWFLTKDSGYVDDDGYHYLVGRSDDVIVRVGENLSPGEIEEVLVEHPAVSDAAVIGAPDLEWGQRSEAVVVLHEGASASESELQDWVRGRLRSPKVPAEIRFRASLPYSDVGKLLRRVLRDEVARGDEDLADTRSDAVTGSGSYPTGS